MSVVVLWASPNKDGLTAAAKDQVLAGLSACGTGTEEIHLNDCRIECCRACGNGWGTCRSEGNCVIGDDFQKVYDQLAAADGIVWVTPVYWHDLAERLKVFLDRLRRCETQHNHALKGKPCLLVACAGGTGNGAVQCLNNLEVTLKHMEMKPVDRLPVIRFNRSYMMPALAGAGKAFGDSLKKNS